MEAVETEEKGLVALREERAREQKKLDVERQKVEAAIDGIRAKRQELGKDRPTLLADVFPEALATYERVRTVRGERGGAPRDRLLLGLHGAPDEERHLRRPQRLAPRPVQESCNRILFSDA